MGPLTVRNDLRQDLLHLDVLRTLPLTRHVSVFAEIASSALALTFGQWLLLISAYALLAWTAARPGVWPNRIALPVHVTRDAEFLIGFVVLPFINCASLFVAEHRGPVVPRVDRLGGTGTGASKCSPADTNVGASLLGPLCCSRLPAFAAFAVLIPMTAPMVHRLRGARRRPHRGPSWVAVVELSAGFTGSAGVRDDRPVRDLCRSRRARLPR